jgi:hypothetical protein
MPRGNEMAKVIGWFKECKDGKYNLEVLEKKIAEEFINLWW